MARIGLKSHDLLFKCFIHEDLSGAHYRSVYKSTVRLYRPVCVDLHVDMDGALNLKKS
jgi:hypothetical protein